MNTLYIDTINNKEIIVRLIIGNKHFEEKRDIVNNRTQLLIPLIEQLLTDHSLSPKDLSSIEVNPGPGSYTGVRVGVGVANALGFALNIPVNEISFTKLGKVVEPVYS